MLFFIGLTVRLEAQAVLITHTPLSEFAPSAALEFRAQPSSPVDWMAVFLRYKGIEEFQARPMTKSEDGSYLLEFDASCLPDPAFSYYLAAGTSAGIVIFPASGAGGPFEVKAKEAGPAAEIPGDIPTPQEEVSPAAPPEPGLPFPIKLSGSGQAVIKEKVPVPGAETYPAAGNIRVMITPPQRGALNINFDSNFSYTSAPLAGNKPLDLSNMNAALFLSHHTIRAGDISINESDYSVQSLGRRGFEYAFDNQKAYLHAFTVNSQEVKGFKGFGLPQPQVSILGGAAGYRILGEALFLKTLFVTGKDTPSQGVNLGLPDDIAGVGGRQGQVLAVIEESRLWAGLLSFKAEFARCRYDADLSDQAGPVAGNAFLAGTGLSSGILTAGLNYRYVDRDFNSIGLQTLANNRSGWEAMIGLSQGVFSLTGSFMGQRDNVSDDPESATTSNLDGSLNLSLAVSPKAQIVVGTRLGKQETDPGGSGAFAQDSATSEFSGSLNLMIGLSSSVNLSVVSSRLKSQAAPETDGSTLTFNLGGSLLAGQWLSLSPSLGFSQRRENLTGRRFDTFNAMTAGELFFLPKAWSMFLTASFSRADVPDGLASTSMDLMGGLNLYLNQLIKVEGLLLSLKGSYRFMDMASVETTDWRAFAQCDLSF
ncbi:MAG TPA: hypothetical protein VGB72_09180 [Acidobacteriota bacterium]